MTIQRGAGASRSSDDLHNEDSFLVADDLGLYAVCDGFGGGPAGEVAAYLAVEAIEDFLSRALEGRKAAAPDGGDGAADPVDSEISAETIDAAVRYALECLDDAADLRPDLEGMETTVTLLLIQRGRAFIGHRGDSRAYLVRGDRVVQLTHDQDWTTDHRLDERPEDATVECFSIDTRRGDTFVLCTDGAEREVFDPGLLNTLPDASPRLLASRIVSAAHRRNPEVDATAVVARIEEDHHFDWARHTKSEPVEDDRGVAVHGPGRRAQLPHLFDYPLTPGRLRRTPPAQDDARSKGEQSRTRKVT